MDTPFTGGLGKGGTLKTNVLSNRTSKPLDVTEIGFGGAWLGNAFREVAEEEAQATLQAAYDNGARHFDTAPLYGLGISERRIGEAVNRVGRDTVTISTKAGRLLEDCPPDEVTPECFVAVPQKKIVYDYSYDGIMKSHEASLSRLGVDHVDVLLVHDVGDMFTFGDRERADATVRQLFDEGGFRALQALKDSKQVAAIGAGVNEWQVCEILLAEGDFDCFLLAGRYTLLEQEPLNSFFPLCQKRDVGIILGGAFNSGILASGPVEGAMYQYGPAPADILERTRKIQAVCDSHGVRLPQAALQFTRLHPVVKVIIPGAIAPHEVEMNMRLLDSAVP
ncbi:MAG: aldo/keto reductase, partial [Hyphomicrobiales bacterium]|nr:aldo/keto reductase [Hyphomicrobiales bacterium]